MKQTNINIDDIKRFPTVTNPIKADDLNMCKVYQYSPARCIVTDYTDEQRADLLEMTKGREIADGIVFASSKYVLNRLHSWQNHEAQKQRAAILGEGWQWIEGLNHGTQPGDVITCIDGTRGRVTKSDPESCCIEFETADGQRLSVAGYFRYSASAKSEAADEDPTLTEKEKRDTLCRLWDAAWHQAKADPKTYRVIVETNEEDPTAPKNEFGRYYMVDKADGCGNVYDRWQIIRSDIVRSPYPVHRPNYAASCGCTDNQAQICIEVENKNNIVRWALRMIDAGRVTDIYADCY